MSNRNNDVFQVLVTKGNQAVLAAGNTVDDLAAGQIGLFDANTGLSVTATAPREFYFALGLDRAGVGSLQDIKTSAGQLIQKKGITGLTYKPHSPGQPKIVTVGGYTAVADTDYAVKVEFRNSRIYRIQGFNPFAKTYAVRTNVTNGDANALTKQIVAEINMDIDGMLIATAVVRQDVTIATHGTTVDYTAGDVIIDADIDALIAFNADPLNIDDMVFTDFTIQSVPMAVRAFLLNNMGFHKLVETDIIVSLVDGFSANATVTVTQELAYAEGTGKNIRQKEYHASAWGGSGPYILSQVGGVINEVPMDALSTTNYDQFIMEYFQKSESGWLEYENVLSTIFAVPATETVTRNSLATLLDVLTNSGGFEALADDALAADVNPLIVEDVITDETKDGIA